MTTITDQLQHFIALGAGVQSSAMALMASAGEITPMPQGAIFADTQAEPASVYRWLDWLEPRLAFPVYRVTKGSLRQSSLRIRTTPDGRKYAHTSIPFHTKNADGSHGMITHRNCTRDYKIFPMHRKLRELARIRRGEQKVQAMQWLGISIDEATRMKDSRVAWLANRYPLIEKRISRRECKAWMEIRGFPAPPRSACYFCPFRSNTDWRALRDNDPEDFLEAATYELEMQKAKATDKTGAIPFLSGALVTIDKLNLSTAADYGQISLFDNECEGHCGV